MPEAGQIDEILKRINIGRGVRINFQQVPAILQNLVRPQYLNNFQKGGSAFHLLLECQKLNGLAVEVLVEYSIIEDYGAQIMGYLKNEFGEFTVLEHFQSFFRFKLNASASIGKVFGGFEDNVIYFSLINSFWIFILYNFVSGYFRKTI